MLPEVIDAGTIQLVALQEVHVEETLSAMEVSLPQLSVWFPWAQSPPDRDAQLARARRAEAAFACGDDYEFSIFEARAGELVGGLRVNPHAAAHTAELGYWIRTDRHRQGFATRAVRVATAAVFSSLPEAAEVQIRADIANTASAGVARKAGFRLVEEIVRPVIAPGHTGRALVWSRTRLGT